VVDVMRTKRLGNLEVAAQGLGCSSLTGNYGTTFDAALATATLQRALDLGIQLLDTSDVYGAHANEEFIGSALQGRRDQAVVATKFGTLGFGGLVAPGGGTSKRTRGDAHYAREACEASLKRLRTDHIDLYFLHRVDPNIPIEETVGGMAALVAQGMVRYLGLCEVSPTTLRRATAVHPIAAVESEWSLWSRDIEDRLLAVARECGVGIVPYAPLGRGFLTGQIKSANDFAPNDGRRHNPRFQGANFDRNLALVRQVEALAKTKRCTAAQLALAWLDQKGSDVVPIPGGDRPEFVEENVGALQVELTSEDVVAIEAVMPLGAAAGDRYADMSWVAGETPALPATGA
jgi:aryl-alcohol dehydrogenase-like predicted oxidoreductase